MNIRIIQLIRTLRLYGQSQYPRRITGTFTVELGNFLLSDVEMFEGHVNSFLPPPRLISFVDHSFNEPFVEALSSAELPRIRIQNVTDRFEFQLERVGIEIVGVSDEKAGQSQ